MGRGDERKGLVDAPAQRTRLQSVRTEGTVTMGTAGFLPGVPSGEMGWWQDVPTTELTSDLLPL